MSHTSHGKDTVDGETFFPEPALLCVRDGHAGSPILNGFDLRFYFFSSRLTETPRKHPRSHSMLVVLLVPRVKLVSSTGQHSYFDGAS